jgi:hypothetical protein
MRTLNQATCCLAMLLAALYAAIAVADDTSMPASEIRAALQQGIQSQSKSKSDVRKSNRVWTVGELVAKFGEPEARRVRSETQCKRGTTTTVWWTWKRGDGSAKAEFLSRGFGRADDPASQRLEIKSVAYSPSK